MEERLNILAVGDSKRIESMVRLPNVWNASTTACYLLRYEKQKLLCAEKIELAQGLQSATVVFLVVDDPLTYLSQVKEEYFFATYGPMPLPLASLRFVIISEYSESEIHEKMKLMGCKSYEIVREESSKALEVLDCVVQGSPITLKQASPVKDDRARKNQEIREGIRRKKEQQAAENQEQANKLEIFKKKLNVCATAFKFKKSEEEKALAQKTIRDLAEVNIAHIPHKSLKITAQLVTASRLVLEWEALIPNTFTPEDIAFAKNIWENSQEFKEQPVVQQRNTSSAGLMEVVTTGVDDVATPLISQFFQYTYKPGWKHSRQLRAEKINESLTPEDNGEDMTKQLIMLFAHYMSIRHVDSTLSRELEDELAKVLMSVEEYQAYKNTCNDERAGIFRGKKRDRVALDLKERLKTKVTELNNKKLPEQFKQIDLLVQILDCVDDLETGFFSYKSETGIAQIKGTMELADNVYEHLSYRAYFNSRDVSALTMDLKLPSDAIKIMRNAIPDPNINPLL